MYNARYASKANFHKPRYRTNIGWQTTKAMAINILQQLPIELNMQPATTFQRKSKNIYWKNSFIHHN